MKIVLPIAGKGTRMRPITHTHHKALIPIADKPVLAHLIDMVLETPSLEVSEIILITGHLEEQIVQWTKKNYPEIPVRFVTQKVPNGTAHALKLVRDFIDEDMLIIFPDALIDVDLEVITEEENIDGIIWCNEVENPQNFGVVAHDENKLMTGLLEKPEEPPSNLVNIGMYYLRDYQSAFSMIDVLYEHEIKAKGEYNFPEALDLMVKNGKDIKVYPVEGWYDCGQIKSALYANKVFCQRLQRENLTSYGDGVVTEKSTVFNSIILDNARIINSDISDSIIGSHSIIKNTKGSVLCGSHSNISGNDNKEN